MARIKGKVKIGDVIGRLEMDLDGAFNEISSINVGGLLDEKGVIIVFSNEAARPAHGRGWGVGFERGLGWLTGSFHGLGLEKRGTRILFERAKGSSHVRYHADSPPF